MIDALKYHRKVSYGRYKLREQVRTGASYDKEAAQILGWGDGQWMVY
jgi:hypothetical protein